MDNRVNGLPEHLACLVENIYDDVQNIQTRFQRDLHCFQMSASFVPVGPYKSYNFHIAVKSSLLSDLKYDKRSSTSNGITWY
ncbi:MAG: hypothetical protein K2L27_08445 [Muribaculaceae bacterium]|nr:hypothetical protein [Muribaculaceae bacterium]